MSELVEGGVERVIVYGGEVCPLCQGVAAGEPERSVTHEGAAEELALASPFAEERALASPFAEERAAVGADAAAKNLCRYCGQEITARFKGSEGSWLHVDGTRFCLSNAVFRCASKAPEGGR